jgi:hypothetical protein
VEKEKLFKSLDGLFAYDTGAKDSGIKDEPLRENVKEYLDSLSENDFRLIMTEFIRIYFVSEEAVLNGYGIEDVSSFIGWLSEYMDIDI